MAVNILGGRLNVVHAKKTIAITDTIVSEFNTAVIYLMNGAPTSYRPERTIKPFENFVEGQGYGFYALQDLDMEDVFYPPFPTGAGTGNALLLEDGTPYLLET